MMRRPRPEFAARRLYIHNLPEEHGCFHSLTREKIILAEVKLILGTLARQNVEQLLLHFESTILPPGIYLGVHLEKGSDIAVHLAAGIIISCQFLGRYAVGVDGGIFVESHRKETGERQQGGMAPPELHFGKPLGRVYAPLQIC